MYTRFLTLEDAKYDTVFLWGARQTGKSTLLKILFPECRYYDLLKGEQFERLNRRPELMREELMICEERELIIIDEIQIVPQLLDEVHWSQIVISGSFYVVRVQEKSKDQEQIYWEGELYVMYCFPWSVQKYRTLTWTWPSTTECYQGITR